MAAPGEKYKAPAMIRPYSDSSEPTHGQGYVWDEDENDWVLGSAFNIAPNRQTGTSYTLVKSDAGKAVEMDNASANTVTVPPDSSVLLPIGTVIEIFQYGAGQTTIVAGSGVDLRSSGAKLKLSGQYASAAIRKIATDEWAVTGELSA